MFLYLNLLDILVNIRVQKEQSDLYSLAADSIRLVAHFMQKKVYKITKVPVIDAIGFVQ